MFQLDVRTLKSLQAIYRSNELCFRVSASARRWLEHWNLGRAHATTQWQLTMEQRVSLRNLVWQKTGVDFESVDVAGLSQQSRIEASQLADNEKLSQRPVRAARVAVKSLPGRPLMLAGQTWYLPMNANLDWDWKELVMNQQHQTVLVVENWQAFECLKDLSFTLDGVGDNPLVVFRGAAHVYAEDVCHDLLNALKLPVYAFVDLDPHGLGIALSLPFFKDMVLPPENILAQLLKPGLNYQRFLDQLPQYRSVLEHCSHPTVTQLWQRLNALGAALPQEALFRSSKR